MYRKKQLFFIAILFISFFSCKTNKVHSKNKTDNKEIISEKNEKELKVYNEEKSKILILKFTINKSPIVTYNYQVIDVKTQKELKKGVFVGAKLEWLDNNTLKGTPHVGMIQKENDEILDENLNTKPKYITIKI
ncbi:hypothetical protein [Polaribacter sargassicola]|uniref:hypothetical protein n=1 Tax=Polaribacter sargassicola TaxID=2836891 RepID=UPI001F30936E|nr:hypothetical protein [Polaribacter sp. DS7-9]MCG1034927.1 hypothetical protein [Polaribacter sp. DS7-9]